MNQQQFLHNQVCKCVGVPFSIVQQHQSSCHSLVYKTEAGGSVISKAEERTRKDKSLKHLLLHNPVMCNVHEARGWQAQTQRSALCGLQNYEITA